VGRLAMNTQQVEAYLRSSAPHVDGIACHLGLRRDAAFLRLSSIDEPKRWAIVASPGSRWFSVEVPGGFTLDHFDEGLDDDEVRAIVDDFLAVAVAYVRSGATRTSVGRLRLPALAVAMPHGHRILRRSLVADVKGLFRLGDRQ
jgi:hypothetical protein